MTANEIKETIQNAPLLDGVATKMLVAWNDKEAGTFHGVQIHGERVLVITKGYPKIEPDVREFPNNIEEMEVMWSDTLVERFGGIHGAMAQFGK